MVKDIMYGTEDGNNYFVQTSCDGEHKGDNCDCISYGENLTEREAYEKAKELSKKFHVGIIRC